MTVEGVNNSNNNAGWYALGAGAIGAGAGAGVAYMTKPFLKDGAPTDSFVKKIEENFISGMKDDQKKKFEALNKTISNFESVKDMESLKTYIKNDEIIKKSAKIMNVDYEELIKQLETLEYDEARNIINDEIISKAKEWKQEMDDTFKSAFKNSWDANKGEFVHDEKKIGLEGFNAVKKAARSIQGKYAMIYGAIAAGVLGVGTYLATMGSKSSAPEQKVDAQA